MLSHVQLFATPGTAACQASLSFTIFWVSSNSRPSSQGCHPNILPCHPLFFLPSIFPSIRVFSNESALCIRWPNYWHFSFSISPSNEYSQLISFTIDWFNLPVVQWTLKSPAPQFKSINSSAFIFLYGPTFTSVHDCWEKTIALTIWIFVSKVLKI